MEVERNLQDAMQAARSIVLNPALLPGGGACEMAVGKALRDAAKNLPGVEQWPYKAIANEIAQVRKLTQFQSGDGGRFQGGRGVRG